MKQQIDTEFAALTEEEKDWLRSFGGQPVLRKFMRSSELQIANSLVKKGIMSKGLCDGKVKSVQYSIESCFWARL